MRCKSNRLSPFSFSFTVQLVLYPLHIYNRQLTRVETDNSGLFLFLFFGCCTAHSPLSLWPSNHSQSPWKEQEQAQLPSSGLCSAHSSACPSTSPVAVSLTTGSRSSSMAAKESSSPAPFTTQEALLKYSICSRIFPFSGSDIHRMKCWFCVVILSWHGSSTLMRKMQMWEALIQKAKDGGLDVIDTYVFWNIHEPSPGNVIQASLPPLLSSSLFLWWYAFEAVQLWREIRPGSVHQDRPGCWALCTSSHRALHLWGMEFRVCSQFISSMISHFSTLVHRIDILLTEFFRGFPVWLKFVPGISFRTDNEPFKVCAPCQYYSLHYTELSLYTKSTAGLYSSSNVIAVSYGEIHPENRRNDESRALVSLSGRSHNPLSGTVSFFPILTSYTCKF